MYRRHKARSLLVEWAASVNGCIALATNVSIFPQFLYESVRNEGGVLCSIAQYLISFSPVFCFCRVIINIPPAYAGGEGVVGGIGQRRHMLVMEFRFCT